MTLWKRLRGGHSARQNGAPAGPFGYAVVGLGGIARHFLEGLSNSPICNVTAVVSGSESKAAHFAERYSAPLALTYASFDTLRENAAVDAVYLALPVSLHREFTERAAAAGKHVLCEKPMASNADDARAMIAACRAAGVKLSIAYRCPYTAVHQRAREIVRSGVLGNHLRIESGFGFKLDAGWRDDPALAGGGSLFDVGIYPLNAARYLLGEEPCGVLGPSAICNSHGLEQSIAWTSVFPSGSLAVCRSSYREHIPDTLRITGTGGTLLLAPAFNHRERLRLQGEYTDPATSRRVKVNERTSRGTASQFRMEAEALATTARTGTATDTPGEDGLQDMVAMEAIYAAAGVRLNR